MKWATGLNLATTLIVQSEMLKYIVDRFFGWMTHEPFIGLLMILAAVVLFLATLSGRRSNDTALWPYSRTLLEAAATAAMFLGLLWAFRAVLNDNLNTFKAGHGRVSAANYQSLKTIWGAPHIQRELSVTHYVTRRVKEELPRHDPTAAPVYRFVDKTVRIDQNSILGAHGSARIRPNQRKKGSAVYNGFDLNFEMTYKIRNDHAEQTRAELHFPLHAAQLQFNNLQVTENGKDLSRELRVSKNSIRWSRMMAPGQTSTILVKYDSRGVNQFYYQIPNAREIRDFAFTLRVDGLSREDLNYPTGCLTPDSIKPTSDGNALLLAWKRDRAITTAGMGIALPKPDQPGARTSLLLAKSPYALMLLIVSISLTFLIIRSRIEFLEIALLSAAYSLLFISMSSVYDIFAGTGVEFVGFMGSLLVGASLTLGLAWLLFRKYKDLFLRNSILVLTGFFTLIYPLAGLFPDSQAAFDGVVFSGIIVYLFLIALKQRLSKADESQVG